MILENSHNGSLALRLIENRENWSREIECVSGILGGARLYAAFVQMLDTISDRKNCGLRSLGGIISGPLIEAIVRVNPSNAEQFAVHADRVKRWHLLPSSPESIERKRQKAQKSREEAIAPFRSAIDTYAMKFSNDPLRYPGGGSYPPHRFWARRYMENYVVSFRELPRGLHKIEVQGFSGPTHDFQWDVSG